MVIERQVIREKKQTDRQTDKHIYFNYKQRKRQMQNRDR